MRRNVSSILLIVLLVACMSFWIMDIETTPSPQIPTVSVAPITNSAGVGQTFGVNVTVTDIAISEAPPICKGLYGWDLNVSFDPVILSCTSVMEGPFLMQAGSTLFPSKINNTVGWVKFGATLLPPYPLQGAVGSGVLATITFQVINVGKSLLNFETTKLNTVIESTLVPIEPHVAEDGLFDNTGAENVPPVAIFYVEPPVAEVNETVTFDASASYDPDGWLFSYYWDLGDGTNSTGIVQHVPGNVDMIAEYSYKQAGIYTVTLTVADFYGETDTTTATVNIGHDIAITEVKAPKTILVNQSALVNVTVENEGCGTETFNVTVYYDSSIIDTWINVSLNVGTSTTLVFTWNTTGVPEGTYDILANATIVEDEVDTADNLFPHEGDPPVRITISPLPVHDIAVIEVTVNPIELIVGGSVSIDVTIENQGTESEVSISVSVYYDSTLIDTQTNIDLVAGAETSRHFTWTTTEVEADDYSIKAEASVIPGETDDADNTKHFGGLVTVLWYPDAEFTYSPSEPIVGEVVTFTASLSTAYHGTIESYSWNFDDGSPIVTETDPIANHTYTTARTYTVSLTVTDNHTLTDTASQSLAIGKMNSTISITLSPTSLTVGQNTTMSGSIDPVRKSVTVTISYRLEEEQTWSTFTTETDENSQYSHIWAPESAGTYEIKARWEGDANTFADETEKQVLTVQEAGPDMTLLLVAGLAVAILVVAILAYLIRVRGKGS